ncbi:MAG: hypothetical protein ABS95_01540 [Verrucomicrobia bacterium SCN 57-15]|nr:MAG: hypothetical protein ABS95_01540 [Verrucomicrobia bacterium SCN 57-15]
MGRAPGQCDLERLVFVSDFDSCAVFAVVLRHFDDPLEQLVRIGKQSGVLNRTSETQLVASRTRYNLRLAWTW